MGFDFVKLPADVQALVLSFLDVQQLFQIVEAESVLGNHFCQQAKHAFQFATKLPRKDLINHMTPGRWEVVLGYCRSLKSIDGIIPFGTGLGTTQDDNFEKLLEKNGSTLRYLVVFDYASPDYGLLGVVQKYCPHLEVLYSEAASHPLEALTTFLDSMKHLSELCLPNAPHKLQLSQARPAWQIHKSPPETKLSTMFNLHQAAFVKS